MGLDAGGNKGGNRERAFELAVAALDNVVALVRKTSAAPAWPGSRFISRAYQPSVAASASSTASASG